MKYKSSGQHTSGDIYPSFLVQIDEVTSDFRVFFVFLFWNDVTEMSVNSWQLQEVLSLD